MSSQEGWQSHACRRCRRSGSADASASWRRGKGGESTCLLLDCVACCLNVWGDVWRKRISIFCERGSKKGYDPAVKLPVFVWFVWCVCVCVFWWRLTNRVNAAFVCLSNHVDIFGEPDTPSHVIFSFIFRLCVETLV